MTKKTPPNPHGRDGDKIVMPLGFEDALSAALASGPMPEKPKTRKRVRKRPKPA